MKFVTLFSIFINILILSFGNLQASDSFYKNHNYKILTDSSLLLGKWKRSDSGDIKVFYSDGTGVLIYSNNDKNEKCLFKYSIKNGILKNKGINENGLKDSSCNTKYSILIDSNYLKLIHVFSKYVTYWIKQPDSTDQTTTTSNNNKNIELIIGFWGGVGIQYNGNAWSIKLTINKEKILINYPSIPCGGELSLISKSKLQYTFREKITTYKEIADALGVRCYRLIGQILNNNDDINVPCFKVVKSDGSLGGYHGSDPNDIRHKIKKIKKEGIEIKDNKIDLDKYLHKF